MKQSNTTARLLIAATMMLVAPISPVVHAEDSGAAPLQEQITVSPDLGLDFGQVMIGVSAVRRMSITNSGAAPIRITGLIVEGKGFGYVHAPELPMVLKPGDTIRIDLQFNPATMVVFSGAVHIQTSLPSFSSYPLSGQGIFPVLIVGRGNIDFGHVAPGQTRIDSFMIRNGGSAPLRNVMVELESGRSEGFEVVGTAEGFDLAPGARRHIAVRLLQQAPAGEIHDVALIHADNGLSGRVEISATINRASRVAPDFATTGGVSLALESIIPNPARESATARVSAGNAGDIAAVLSIIDMRGEIVATPFDGMIRAGRTESISFDIRTLPVGRYRVVLRSPGRVVSTELVVVR